MNQEKKITQRVNSSGEYLAPNVKVVENKAPDGGVRKRPVGLIDMGEWILGNRRVMTMKKIMYFAAICVALVACNTSNNEGLTLLTGTIDLPQIRLASNAGDAEGQLGYGSDTLNFHWEEGDSVTIDGIGNFTLVPSSISGQTKPTTATFSGRGTPVKDDEVVFMGSYNVETNSVDYIDGTFNPVVAGTVGEGGTSFSINSLYPVLKLPLKGTATLGKILFYTTNRYGYESKATTLNFVTTTLPSGLQLNEETTINVYYPLLESSNFDETATIKFYDTESTPNLLLTMKMTKTFAVNTIFGMPELIVNAYPNVSYYEGWMYYGKGINIEGTIWAPVNCGYDANHTYGLLYQWGRQYGQAYELGYIVPVPMAKTDDTETNKYNVGIGYVGIETNGNWFRGDSDKTLWDEKGKGSKDPCPDGWRVPEWWGEMARLSLIHSGWETNTVGGVSQKGLWFSGSTAYSESVPRVFLPAAGIRDEYGMARYRGITGSYWSSTPYNRDRHHLAIWSNNEASIATDAPFFGYSVRCVQE